MNTLIDTEKLEEKRLLKIDDLIQITGLSNNTIYRYCDAGIFKKHKFGGRNYWKSSEVKEALVKKGII